MGTYLELCNEVNDVLGLQGTISDVSNPSGLQKYIVRATKNAWIDIQNHREDWSFMVGTNTGFSTVADQIEYTPTEVFGTALAAEDLSTYKVRKGIFLETTPLNYVLFENVPTIDNEVGSRPRWFSINFVNNNLIFDKPNDIYNLTIRYNRAVQVLSDATDIPILPSTYHNVIVYHAVKRVTPYIGQVGIDTHYMEQARRSMGELMRKYVNRKRTDIRGIA